MSALLFDDVRAAVGGRLVARGAGLFGGVSTDTRSLTAGEVFFALSGPNFDGNRYAEAALAAGAAGLVLRDEEGLDARFGASATTVLAHPEPRRALAELARWHRARLGLPVVGITGSCGKTTTKNLLVSLLARVQRVVGSPLSYNNDVGVPLTLLAADASTDVVVAELGTNNPGEIEALCRIAAPSVGVITNVGASHLEGLGSIEGVAREKGELARALPEDGLLVIDADGRYADWFRAVTRARVLTFSVEGAGDLNASDLYFHAAGTSFRVDGLEVNSPLLGTHNVHNLLAALAVCRGLGLELEEVLPALGSLAATSGRLERHELDGLVVIDDSYNANPESARAAVRVLAGQHGFARRVLVLGDMLELGPMAPELHHAVGRSAAEEGVDRLVLVGNLTRAAAAGALEAGMAEEDVLHFATRDEAEAQLHELFRRGDVVLVKGSRGMALERLVRRLREEFAPDPEDRSNPMEGSRGEARGDLRAPGPGGDPVRDLIRGGLG